MKLHYTEAGSGSPLILLHGNGEDGTYFRSQVPYFSRRYRVIAVDTRGHGASPRGRAPFTIRQFAEDLREFMDLMGISRADILGFSDGGNIAMVFAMKYPGRVHRLILCGANLDGHGVRPSIQIPIVLAYYKAEFLRRWFPVCNSAIYRQAELLGLMVHDPHIRPEELRRIRAKTLVIAGTRDMIKREHTRMIYENLPDAKLRWIRGDHFIAAKQPRQFNHAVQSFLNHS